MNYIISDEELVDFFNPYLDLKRSRGELEYLVKDFLKSKKPVTCIAEGEGATLSGKFINWHLNQDMQKKFKIYMEEI